jgi:uncharacterized protein (DUF486 family)
MVEAYKALLPIKTFPWIPLTIAAFFQVFAWTSGSTLLGHLSLVPRILILWLYAGGEYMFMSPSINAGVEVLGMSESLLVVIYQVVTLVVFMFVNTAIYKNPFKWNYAASFALLAGAVYMAYL